jgi:hypothetical protein
VRCSVRAQHLQDECLATLVLRMDAQVAVAGAADSRVTALDRERFAAAGVPRVISALGTPVRLAAAARGPATPPPAELVGALVVANKLHAGAEVGAEGAEDAAGFSAVDRALWAGVAEQLGMALKLAARHAIVATAQEDHVAAIVAASSVVAGLRLVHSAFPQGAMWAAVEVHAAWLVGSADARLYAPPAAADTADGDSGGTAVRRTRRSGWQEEAAEVRRSVQIAGVHCPVLVCAADLCTLLVCAAVRHAPRALKVCAAARAVPLVELWLLGTLALVARAQPAPL